MVILGKNGHFEHFWAKFMIIIRYLIRVVGPTFAVCVGGGGVDLRAVEALKGWWRCGVAGVGVIDGNVHVTH